jgi:hypothetical protein
MPNVGNLQGGVLFAGRFYFGLRSGYTTPSAVFKSTRQDLEHGADVQQEAEQNLVKQFVAQATDERFDRGVLHRLAGGDIATPRVIFSRLV